MDDHLRVGVISAELVTLGRQLLPQLAEVVNLAVEDDLNRTVCGRHRLLAVNDVQDREAILRECDTV